MVRTKLSILNLVATLPMLMLVRAAAYPAEAAQEPILVHTFVADGVTVGYLFGRREGSFADVYSDFEIRSGTSHAATVLYRITRLGLYAASGSLDLALRDNGSRGFTIVARVPTAVTVDCCHVNGSRDTVPPFTVEWRTSESRFESRR